MVKARGVKNVTIEMIAMLDHFFLTLQLIAFSGVSGDSQPMMLVSLDDAPLAGLPVVLSTS